MLPSMLLPIRLLAIPALLCALASLTRAADPIDITLNTTSVVQCDTFNISWTGGSPDYTVTITSNYTVAGTANNGTTLPDEVFNVAGTSFQWTADRCGGTPIEIIVSSESAHLASSVSFAVNGSTNTSCLSDAVLKSSECLASRPNSASQERPLLLPTLIALVAAGLALSAA